MEEERAEREKLTTHFVEALGTQLPALFSSLSRIKDFRNPKKLKHQLHMVLFYGILCFVLQMPSRRAANRELTGPVLLEHLRQLFPEIESLPHQDTLNRILSGVEVESLQETHVEMIRRLVRKKKFHRWLVSDCYPVAVDGTQKAVRRDQVNESWLQRRINADTDKESTQYYVYVLEACLCFHNGLRLPLMTEFLNYAEGDTDKNKQDCETKAFHRLARRLKVAFPKLRIMVLLDGLYPNGPILKTCHDNNWQFMIVLQDKSLPSVWEEFYALRKLETGNELNRTWWNRHQHFFWVNRIDYRYGPNHKHKQIIHLVVCEERWEEIDENGQVVEKQSRHAWLSSKAVTKQNVHERCNLAARHRWGIESALLVEKRQGYQYEHLFSFNWNAMKGYHYLMHMGHALNALARYSSALAAVVREKGVRGFIQYLRGTLVNPWLNPQSLHERLNPTAQLRRE